MSKLESEPPPRPRRPARRSMVELAGMLQSDGVETAPPAQLVAAAWPLPTATPGENSTAKIARARPSMIGERTSQVRGTVLTHSLLHRRRKRAAPADDSTQRQLDEVTLTAARSARERRSWMLEIVKANSDGAPPGANDRHAHGDTDAGGQIEAPGEPREQDNNAGAPAPDGELRASGATAADYRAAAVELLNANVNAALEFARLFAHARPPSEFVTLSTSHLRNHFERIITQVTALGAMSQSLTKKKPNGAGSV